jgi:hypothetical protein
MIKSIKHTNCLSNLVYINLHLGNKANLFSTIDESLHDIQNSCKKSTSRTQQEKF